MAAPLQAGQYVARDVDNQPKNPQPGDVEITDAFGNVFDNYNADWVDYDKDNVAVNPQPAYQNLDYVQYTVENTAVSPAWEPDAAQWVARGVDNQVRTPQPYVRSPLWPAGAPDWYNPVVGDGVPLRTITVVLNAEDSEALIVTEDDVAEIELSVSSLDFAQIRLFG